VTPDPPQGPLRPQPGQGWDWARPRQAPVRQAGGAGGSRRHARDGPGPRCGWVL